jgi:hypothetical protein
MQMVVPMVGQILSVVSVFNAFVVGCDADLPQGVHDAADADNRRGSQATWWVSVPVSFAVCFC